MFLECGLLFSFFFLDWQEKKYVAAENKERNQNLLRTDIFMMSIVPAVAICSRLAIVNK